MNCTAIIKIGQNTSGYVMGECGTEMAEVGGVGKSEQYSERIGGELCFGSRELILYQCPSCKTIKLT